MKWLKRLLFNTLTILFGTAILTTSTLPPANKIERVRVFTRSIEFDYVEWTLDALGLKISENALGASDYLADGSRHDIALQYLQLMAEIQQAEAQLNDIYANPEVSNPETASQELRAKLQEAYGRRSRLAPIGEAVLQDQVSYIAGEFGLTAGGQPLPPVMFHSTPLPLALIVSPRDVIRQDADISLAPDLTVDQRASLETQVDSSLDVSSLVVPIGGVGVYPTMVMQTSDINWLAEVISHEWIHNYLTLRPLGIIYLTSPELRIMNETTAAIAGKEIGRAVIERFYPELLPPPPAPPPPPGESQPSPPVFDFRAEMHQTRERVDELLSLGKIAEAEDYMEQRRVFFWENGYHIRKLNQAYFAFYGAYADEPGGPAGEDPVGAAVRLLRAQSDSLAGFINRIAWITSFEELQQAVAPGAGQEEQG
ncbi:MAG: hypothetical protein EHM70_15945 [Chloroflexota bacterium]|nr:MAG: hypothetical protein EHM70_15945 [Chloroflexota bacterium]